MRSTLSSLFLITVVGASLSCDSTPPTPPPPPPGPPLDVVLAAGQARAGKVTRPAELIGGPVAYGRAGDVWKLYNSKARFLIQDVGAAVGLDLYGGNLIDADLVRPGDDGTNGHDLFRESFPIIGLHVLRPTSIEVISDGTQGGPAHLRVHGTDAPSDILPQIDVLGQDLGGAITVDYVLAPDVPYLEITTTYQTEKGQSLTTLGLGDFLSFGGSLALLSPENGFTGADKSLTFLAGIGDGASYGYVYPKGVLQTPITDASGTLTILKTEAVPVDGSTTVTRYFIVGSGDAASVTGPMYALHNIPTAPLTGIARDPAGKPLADARVTLFTSMSFTSGGDCVDQAKSGADGSYRFDVPPGDYVAIGGGVGRLHGAQTSIHLTMSGAQMDIPVGALGSVTLDVGEVSASGARVAVPAKVSFTPIGGESPNPIFGPDPTESERFGLGAVAFTPDGKGVANLRPGHYTATVSRGVEYDRADIDLMVPADGTSVTLTADLHRVVDTTGWLAGDFHQHSQGSIDSGVPIVNRLVENMAEGIEYPAATDHDNIIDNRPLIAAHGWGKLIGGVPGNEISVNGVGHFNAYPMSVDPAAPLAKVGARYWANLSIADVGKKVHTEPQPVVLHVSHPRTKQLAGWFNAVHFDPTTGTARDDFPIDQFQAVEVNGDLGAPEQFLAAGDAAMHKSATQTVPSGVPALADWFALLNQGVPITALGNSDTHQRNGGTGYPRNLVRFGSDDPSAVAPADLVTAIRAQKVSVSNGPFVTVTLDGKDQMGLGEVVNTVGKSKVLLGVKIQAPAWVDVSSLEVYCNGRPLSLRQNAPGQFEQRPDGESGSVLTMPLDMTDATSATVRLDGAVTVTPTVDSWYVVIVRGAKSMSPIASGSPYGYTNPVYDDIDGNGWKAPRPL